VLHCTGFCVLVILSSKPTPRPCILVAGLSWRSIKELRLLLVANMLLVYSMEFCLTLALCDFSRIHTQLINHVAHKGKAVEDTRAYQQRKNNTT